MKQSLILTLLFLLSTDLSANSMRCGNKVVKTGDSGNQLIKKCGNPKENTVVKNLLLKMAAVQM